QEADATEAKAILSRPPEQKAQDETDWCTAATASCDRLAMSRLAMAFEQAYARSVMRRIGINVATSGRQNVLAQEGVLHEASLRKVSAGADFLHPSHGTQFDSTSIDEFLFTQRAGAADPAYESAERNRFKVFLSREFVEQRPKAWQSIKTALADQANFFRQMP